jgi:hypothetical protein
MPHDATIQSYLKVIGLRKLTGGNSVCGKDLNKVWCRIFGTEPNFRRLLRAADTGIFDAAVAKRMS